MGGLVNQKKKTIPFVSIKMSGASSLAKHPIFYTVD